MILLGIHNHRIYEKIDHYLLFKPRDDLLPLSFRTRLASSGLSEELSTIQDTFFLSLLSNLKTFPSLNSDRFLLHIIQDLSEFSSLC
jgi:hypothetical protein